MIEVHYSYDTFPGIDQQAYGELVKKVVDVILKAPGLVEFRAQRNVLGSPLVRATSVWQTLTDWAKFEESAEYRAIAAEFRASYITNVRIEVWRPSPVVPEPLRPG